MKYKTLLIGFTLLVAGPAFAGETLEYNLDEGLTYSFEQTNEMQSVISAGSMVVEQQFDQLLRGQATVLESKNGVPSRMRLSFEPNSGSTTTISGSGISTEAFSLAGETVVVVVANDRVISIESSDGQTLPADTQLLDQLADIAVFPRGLLPGREVDVGETWSVDLKKPEQPLLPNLELRVEGFEERGGRRIAVLYTEGTISGSEDGTRTEGILSGPLVVDVQTGLPIATTFAGELEFESAPMDMRGMHNVALSSSARIGDAVSAAGAPKSTSSNSDWRVFTHSSGATLSHPSDWRAVEMQSGIQLWPPGAGDAEMVVATGVPTNGTTSPRAPDVAAYLDASLFQMVPGISRNGAPTDIEAANGPGALYQYSGALQDGSRTACNVYVTIENGVALSLSAIAPPSVLASRSATLAGIFRTLELGSAATASAPASGGGSTPTGDDSRLVGMFAGEALAGGGVYVNTQLVYVLNADGTLYYGAQSHFNASERDINGNTRWSATGNSDGSVESGRWSARNGMLTIRWDSGQRSLFAYGFEPDGSLVLRDPNTRKLINFYSRVR